MTSEDDECPVGGWTIETLYRLILLYDDRNKERFASRTEAIKIASDAAKEASDKLAIDLRERLKPLENSISRTEYESQHKMLEKDLNLLALRVTAVETSRIVSAETRKESVGSSYMGVVVAGTIFAILMSLATTIFNAAVYFRH